MPLFFLTPKNHHFNVLIIIFWTMVLCLPLKAEEGPEDSSPLSPLTMSSAQITSSMSEPEKLLYFELASKLRCPTCSGLSILQSDAPFSLQIRGVLAEKIQAGDDKQRIIDFFTQRYGLWILREPPKEGFHLLAWWIPLLLLLAAPIMILFMGRKKSLASNTEQILNQMERELEVLRKNIEVKEMESRP